MIWNIYMKILIIFTKVLFVYHDKYQMMIIEMSKMIEKQLNGDNITMTSGQNWSWSKYQPLYYHDNNNNIKCTIKLTSNEYVCILISLVDYMFIYESIGLIVDKRIIIIKMKGELFKWY